MVLTPAETATVFIGSGALGYAWWLVTESHGISQAVSPDDWYVILYALDDDGNPDLEKTIDHEALSRAVDTLARTAPDCVNADVIRECRNLINGSGDTDFDCAQADQVLQYVMFGEVIYG